MILVEETNERRNGKKIGIYECPICKKDFKAIMANAKNGRSTKCKPCSISLIRKTHGEARTKLYYVWGSMIQRCENPNSKSYKNYGANGITVCPSWRKDFEEFSKWAKRDGYREGLTIERKNVLMGYSPDNCIWIPKSEQTKNTSRSIINRFTKEEIMNIYKEWDIEETTKKELKRKYNLSNKGLDKVLELATKTKEENK